MSENSDKHTTEKKGCLGRRDFLRLSGAAVSGLALSPFLFNKEALALAIDELPVLDNYNPTVTSYWVPKRQYGDSYDQFKAMIRNVTDFSWLGSNDKVMLKLALNSGTEYPASTDPWMLDSMIKLLVEQGMDPANILVGDQSGGEYVVKTEDTSKGSSRELCDEAGLLDVILDNGATPIFFEELADEVGFENAYFLASPENPDLWPQSRPMYVTTYVNEVDHIIYLPRVASHIIADVTSGMKIGVGFLRDDSRLTFHQGGENFYAMYEEVNHIPQIHDKLRLIASSGRSILRTRGPDRGDVVVPDYALMFASDDLLAHELLAYSWLKLNGHDRFLLSPTVVNDAFIMTFMRSIPGKTTPTPSIPELDVEDSPFLHPAVLNFMEHKGGRPGEIIWASMNDHPEEEVTNQLESLMTY